MSQNKWIILCANVKYVKRIGYDNVYKSVKSIFKSDLLDIVSSDGAMDHNQDDIYVLIKCNNYHKHVERLKKCEYIYDVLGSFNNPQYVSDSEVEQYRHCIGVKTNVSDLFSVGDFVDVLSGPYRNLSGIVEHVDEDIVVFFKLFVKTFCVSFSPKNLKLSKSPGVQQDETN